MKMSSKADALHVNCEPVVQLEKYPLICSTRFGLAIIGFFGMVIIYALRVNLSMAMVNGCMLKVNATADSDAEARRNLSADDEGCGISAVNGTQPTRKGEFAWSKDIVGLILGAFFWGYLTTQIIGGLASQRFGAKIVFGSTVLAGTIVTFLTPVAARLSWVFLVVLRVLLGVFQGVSFPVVLSVWTHWAPPLERSTLTGLTFAGCQIGNVLALPLTGFLCEHGFADGWPSAFYVLGICSFVFFVAWMLLVSDTPTTHKRISAEERNYIVSSLADEVSDSDAAKKHRPPWRQILTSMPVWACIIGHWSGDWGDYMLLTCMPSFMEAVLKFNLSSLGLLAALPYIAFFAGISAGGLIADFILARHWLNTLNTRRLMMVVALGSQAVFLVAASYCRCGQEMLAVAFLTLGQGLSGLQYAGFIVNYMDIAPQYSGTILGIGNTLSCFCGILAPFAMAVLTPNNTRGEWQTVFWLTAVILVAGTAFYVTFASGDVQPWAKVEDASTDGKETQPLMVEEKSEHGAGVRTT